MLTGKEIKFKRFQLGISQPKLAAALGVATAYISFMENDIEKSFLTEELYQRLEEVFKQLENNEQSIQQKTTFGTLNAIAEMRKEISRIAEEFDDAKIMKIYDFAVYVSRSEEKSK